MKTLSSNTQAFKFNGNASDYFKIWIVNILLTIITFGIYSAWAKVRNRRYLYGNTTLDNCAFDYVADPLKILKGRLIALVLFILYLNHSLLPESIQALLLLIFIALLPFIVIKALCFSFYNTTYRNIHFDFKTSYWQAFWVYIGLPLITFLSLGLAYPYLIKQRHQFIIANSRYGTIPFKMSASTSAFYWVFLATFLVAISTMFAAFIFKMLCGFMTENSQLGQLIGSFAVIISAYLFIFAYIYTHLNNLIINHTSLAGYKFTSQLALDRVFWLYISNTIAIVLSFGLLIPWAKIRMLRYRVSCLALHTAGDFNEFISDEKKKPEAIGEEVGDLFDIEIGL